MFSVILWISTHLTWDLSEDLYLNFCSGKWNYAWRVTKLFCCRGLPCGVQPPEPVPGPDGDKLATIAARFSYFQERKSSLSTSAATVVTKVDLRRNINPPARYKNARPTVRLRPRQVLCSKCRSICNENSENVDVSKKRKHEEMQQQPQVQQVSLGITYRSIFRLQKEEFEKERKIFYYNRNVLEMWKTQSSWECVQEAQIQIQEV